MKNLCRVTAVAKLTDGSKLDLPGDRAIFIRNNDGALSFSFGQISMLRDDFSYVASTLTSSELIESVVLVVTFDDGKSLEIMA